jgi:hypothetical protein
VNRRRPRALDGQMQTTFGPTLFPSLPHSCFEQPWTSAQSPQALQSVQTSRSLQTSRLLPSSQPLQATPAIIDYSLPPRSIWEPRVYPIKRTRYKPLVDAHSTQHNSLTFACRLILSTETNPLVSSSAVITPHTATFIPSNLPARTPSTTKAMAISV